MHIHTHTHTHTRLYIDLEYRITITPVAVIFDLGSYLYCLHLVSTYGHDRRIVHVFFIMVWPITLKRCCALPSCTCTSKMKMREKNRMNNSHIAKWLKARMILHCFEFSAEHRIFLLFFLYIQQERIKTRKFYFFVTKHRHCIH